MNRVELDASQTDRVATVASEALLHGGREDKRNGLGILQSLSGRSDAGLQNLINAAIVEDDVSIVRAQRRLIETIFAEQPLDFRSLRAALGGERRVRALHVLTWLGRRNDLLAGPVLDILQHSDVTDEVVAAHVALKTIAPDQLPSPSPAEKVIPKIQKQLLASNDDAEIIRGIMLLCELGLDQNDAVESVVRSIAKLITTGAFKRGAPDVSFSAFPDAAIPSLLSLTLKSEQGEPRIAAIALTYVHNLPETAPALVPQLREALIRSKVDLIRTRIAEKLGKADPLSTVVIDTLVEVLQTAPAEVRVGAIKGLSSDPYLKNDLARGAVVQALNDPSPMVRKAAGEAYDFVLKVEELNRSVQEAKQRAEAAKPNRDLPAPASRN